MSRIIASAAIRGAHRMVERAEEDLARQIDEKGKDARVEYPNTAYYLPIMLLFLGQEVKTLGDLEESLQEARKLLPPVPSEEMWLPYLGDTLNAGAATLLAEETIEVLKFINGPDPTEGIWLSYTDDTIFRNQGLKLVDGRMPGFAAVVGSCPTNEQAVELARGLQARNILVFMAGHTNGKAFAEQLAEEGIDMDWDTFLVPYGK
ncbi:MAG: CO dehydrogenase/CO-methylating acetyl-CoA synthase complex subunit beta, partial [Planctomycetota bacterium]